MVEIPNSAIDRIIRKSGAFRVSKSAIIELRKELEDYGIELSKMAVEIAAYAGKRTVEGDDIILAIRKLKMIS
ncbi:MAG: histone family protein [Candidatus Hodarchaeota archaeon]